MKSTAAFALVLLFSSAAFAQDDERTKRIVERIEKEIRDSHEKTREEIRAIIRAEIQKSQGKPAPAPAPEARPAQKVYLGISADDLSDADRQALGSSSGIKVAEVRGPAKEAGIQSGDLLVEFDGEAVSEDKLGELLAKHRPGDSVPAVVLRSKKRVTVKILLAERKD
ncbi:MAG TPA: PDZ domain-containing protein [Planctomycetota bacterium]|nr:PDZ domain-containing protein [Planctomycetota bacterium]